MGSNVQRAAREPERLRFESEVVARNGQSVELAETYFFARSGGQPADRGTVDDIEVVDVRKEAGRVIHELASEPSFDVGDRVEGRVNPEYRTYCRRAHTASHVVYGAGRRILEDLGYGGFEIDDRKVRVDLASSSPLDEAALIRLERLANEAVWAGRAVTWEERPLAEARSDEQIAFNVATEEGVFAEAAQVRIVDIDGWDRAACGGTHVRDTAEIGPIRMLDRSNPGQGLTRVEFAVGPAAIEHQARLHGDARAAARALDTPTGSLVDAVSGLRELAEERAERIDRLERELLEERLDRLAASSYDVDGTRAAVGVLPLADGDVANELLRDRIADGELDVVVATDGDERSTITVAANEAVDANGVVEAVTDALGGGGGGGSDFAQGGGIPAPPSDVVDHVRERGFSDG